MIAKLLYVVSFVALVQARPEADTAVLPNGCPSNYDVYKYLPHESDRAQFYHCVKGERFQVPCPVGTTFDADLEFCAHENGVVNNRNSGSGNSGSGNSGNHNSGSRNSGNFNSGNNNSGNFNSGSNNSGNHNSGSGNTGNHNSGSRNTGSNNSGSGNTSNNNSGSNHSRNTDGYQLLKNFKQLQGNQ